MKTYLSSLRRIADVPRWQVTVNLHEIIESVVEHLKEQMDAAKIDLELDLGEAIDEAFKVLSKSRPTTMNLQ